jgi:DNA-binding NarL/FixJ family response regulator
MGGYPNLRPRYEQAGFRVIEATNQRKALKLLAAEKPDVIVAEFIYTPDFRDRVCNLDTLCSQIRMVKPDLRLIVLYEIEDAASLERFRANFEPFAAFPHPFDPEQLLAAVREAAAQLARSA